MTVFSAINVGKKSCYAWNVEEPDRANAVMKMEPNSLAQGPKQAQQPVLASQRTDNLQNNTVIKSSDQETISGKSPLHSDLSAQQQNNQQSTSANQHSNGATSQPTSNSPVPRLMLVNTNLGLTLDISSGDILGRTTGPYASKLSGFPGISGKHLVFNYDMVDGWSFRDIGSSNGTKYHKTNKDWQNIAITNVNIPVPVENRSYILIANVEFVVQIENISNTGTQRL